MSKYDRIIWDPEICGGTPIIKGTRVLAMDILDWKEEGIGGLLELIGVAMPDLISTILLMSSGAFLDLLPISV